MLLFEFVWQGLTLKTFGHYSAYNDGQNIFLSSLSNGVFYLFAAASD